ncbi:MAG: hypothetical protein NVS2B17_04900 [Candidatus Velthaea sp.]
MRSPQWSTFGEASRLFFSGATVATALPIALVVGTTLVAINQGSVIARGAVGPETWLRILLNYAVPFCVSSYAFLSAHRVHNRDLIE